MEQKNSTPGNSLGVCKKLYNALNIAPVVRRSLTLRSQQQEEALLARLGSKAEGQEREIVITDVEKVAVSAPTTLPGPVARRNSGKSSEEIKETAPAQIRPAKDINSEVEDYINRTRSKFKD